LDDEVSVDNGEEEGRPMPLFRAPGSDDEDLDDEFVSEYQIDEWERAEELYGEPDDLFEQEELIIIDDDPPDEQGKSCPVCGKDTSGMSAKVRDFPSQSRAAV
jgi:hypothetical protein